MKLSVNHPILRSPESFRALLDELRKFFSQKARGFSLDPVHYLGNRQSWRVNKLKVNSIWVNLDLFNPAIQIFQDIIDNVLGPFLDRTF